MRLAKARIQPIQDGEETPEQLELFAPMRARRGAFNNGDVLNIFRTFGRAPEAMKAFMGWGNYLVSKRSSLPPREREIAILRAGINSKAGYEWVQHVEIGLKCGLTAPEIEAIKAGPSDPSWSAADRLILQMADELDRDRFVSDPTWAALDAHFSERQKMDLVFTVAQYTQLGMILNTFGVQLDAGQTLDPDLKGF